MVRGTAPGGMRAGGAAAPAACGACALCQLAEGNTAPVWAAGPFMHGEQARLVCPCAAARLHVSRAHCVLAAPTGTALRGDVSKKERKKAPTEVS